MKRSLLSKVVDFSGIPAMLLWGYAGLLLFMIGDGVETSFLSRLFLDMGFQESLVGFVFTLYGITATIGAYMAGALSDIWGPRKAMAIGAIIWLVLHAAMLLIALPTHSYTLLAITYGLRGFGYPLFAYGFLIWVIASSPKENLNTAMGWFWCCFTAGYPVIGSLLAASLLPIMLPASLLWLSWVLVAIGSLLALVMLKERTGFSALTNLDDTSLAAKLLGGITIMFSVRTVGYGAIIRLFNTASQFGIWVFFPIYFTTKLSYSLEQWATLLSIMMGVNMASVIVFGKVSDRWSWRKSCALFGGVFCTISCLLLYYLPVLFPGQFIIAALAAASYGISLAGYIPLPAMMTAQAPDRQGQVMASYSLGAGASAAVGPLIGTLFIGSINLEGVVWVYAILHLISAFLSMLIRSPGDGQPITKSA